MKESEREQTKLLATALNTMGVNTALAGLVVPLVAYLYKVPSAPSAAHLLPACFVWPMAGLVLHLLARLVLKRSRPMTEVLAVYIAPFVLVIGGALLAWRNSVVMKRAHARDRTASARVDEDAGLKPREGRLAAE